MNKPRKDTKLCCVCNEYKKLTSFYLRSGTVNQFRHQCIPCHKNMLLEKRYGITSADKENLFTLQGKKCAICPKTAGSATDFVVDHCHKSGEVRGILCPLCNKGLGKFRDQVENLKSAIRYLERSAMDEGLKE